MLSLAVTDCIQDLYPLLRVGTASVRFCTIIALRLGLVSHGNYTESEGSD